MSHLLVKLRHKLALCDEYGNILPGLVDVTIKPGDGCEYVEARFLLDGKRVRLSGLGWLEEAHAAQAQSASNRNKSIG
ncbi:hypothetical protein ABZQ86_25925 [Pseudomonas aeruginosa]